MSAYMEDDDESYVDGETIELTDDVIELQRRFDEISRIRNRDARLQASKELMVEIYG